MDDPVASPSASPLPPGHETDNLTSTAWAILLLISLLLVILLTSYYLQLRKIRIIHETVVSIVLGLVVGMVVHFGITKRGEICALDCSLAMGMWDVFSEAQSF